MKTSNKLLLGFLILIVAGIVTFLSVAKVYISKELISGNGNRKDETRAVSTINNLDIQGRFSVFLTQGEKASLKINADENLLKLVESTNEEGELSLRIKGRINSNDVIKLYITADSLQNLDFSAGANVETPQELRGEKLKINSSAGASGNLKLRYNEIVCDAHAGSDLTLLGITNISSFIFSSGASINAEELKTKRASVEGSAGGNASINVEDELSAELSAGASLDYSGNPKVTKMETTAGGSINKD